MKLLLLPILLAITSSSAASASQIHCKPRYGGTLSLAKSNSNDAAKVITLAHDKQHTLTTDFDAAHNPGPNDVQFTFAQCSSSAPRWNTARAVVGQLHVTTSGTTTTTAAPWHGGGDHGCVTAAAKSGHAARHVLTVEACAGDTDDERLARQWFMTTDMRTHGRAYVAVTLRGAPNGKFAMPYVDEAQVTAGEYGVAVRKQDTGMMLAVLDVKDM